MRDVLNARTTPAAAARGFTLIEMLVVVFIILLLVGILLPALSGAQNTARIANAQALNKNILDASGAFRASNGRAPGFFPETAMGHMDNEMTGFTQMENLLLDLAIEVPDQATVGNPDDATSDFITVGPYADGDSRNVIINRFAVGDADGPGYLRLDADQLRAVEGQATTVDLYAGAELVKGMPDVLDPWGMPVLAWRRDPGSSLRVPDGVAVDDVSYFASIRYTPGTDRSGFYWASNAGVLNSGGPTAPNPASENGLTSANINMYALSVLGGQIATDSDQLVRRSMAGLLGSPALPVEYKASPTDPWRPAEPRGDIIVMSAGPDRVFVAPSTAFDGETTAAISEEHRKVVDYLPSGATGGGSSTPSIPVDTVDDILTGGG